MHKDLVIIGGGPAGLAAALEAHKQGITDILILETNLHLGGILQQCIHLGFGLHTFQEELTGPEYAKRFIDECKQMGISYRLDTPVLDISEEKIITASNQEYGLMHIHAKAIILAMGCLERSRGAINIPGTRPSGIMNAGLAQQYMNLENYKVGKRIFILGSGDIGLIMARRMKLEGCEVLGVAELLPYSSGLNRNIVQCLHDYDIPLYLSHTVTKVYGKERLEGIELSEVDAHRNPIPGTQSYIDCDTLLLSVGLIPENDLTRKAGIDIDPKTKGPIVSNYMETSLPGVFACGNVVHVHDLVDYVSKEGKLAGYHAAHYVIRRQVTENENNHKKMQSLLEDNTGEKTQQEVERRDWEMKETIQATRKQTTKKPKIQTCAGSLINYVVPQRLELPADENITLYFRVSDVIPVGIIRISIGDQIIKERKRRHMKPGEMEHLVLTNADLTLIEQYVNEHPDQANSILVEVIR